MKINSYEHACELMGRDPIKSLPDVSGMPVRDQKSTVAGAKLSAITEASWLDNKDWKDSGPDWDNGKWDKWVPVFDMQKSKNNPTGFRFNGSVDGYAHAFAGAGSRLRFASEGESDWHAQQHLELYRDLMVIPG